MLRLTTGAASMLVTINGGVVKLTDIAPGATGGSVVKGLAILPLKDTSPAAAGSATLRVITMPEGSRKITDKEIVWLDAAEHVDLYDCEPHVSRAVAVTAEFLHQRLQPERR